MVTDANQNITIIDADTKSFFELSEELGDAPSVRRILSLLRLGDECRTIVLIENKIEPLNGSKCSNKITASRRCDSCTDYLNFMKEHVTEYTLKKKICTKMLFFSCPIDHDQEITTNKYQDFVLGYAVVHLDHLQIEFGGKPRVITRRYVPECVLSPLNKKVRGFKYGNFNGSIIINDQKFNIEKGNYFSQQNAITNCCAHASIKTTLRGYDKDISCSAINNALITHFKISSKNISSKIKRFARGLKPDEMLTAIRDLSKISKNIKPLDPFLVRAHDLPVSVFVETIYRAIESKIPVILLLRIPENLAIGNKFQGHTISIVGHTFNRHNWCAYGSGYFSSVNKESYLSSYVWCDNYVVQDDNFGPAYHLPCSFLTDYYEYGLNIEKFGLNIASQKELSNSKPNYPLAAIIIPPAELKGIQENIYQVESIAVDRFVHQVNNFGRKKKFKHTVDQKIQFDRYFYYIFKHQDDKPKVFITRTILIEREEYLESSIKTLYSEHKENGVAFPVTDAVRDVLPKYFWLTEISVPELYWINKAKVGEIIMDIDCKPGRKSKPKLIRLPYFLAIYPEKDNEYYPFYLNEQKKAHHPIIKKEKGIIRQFSF